MEVQNLVGSSSIRHRGPIEPMPEPDDLLAAIKGQW